MFLELKNSYLIHVLLKLSSAVFGMPRALRVNFAKSCMMGIYVDVSFLNLNEIFFHCSIVLIHFQYLGLLVGFNSKRLSSWKSLMGTLINRLSSWSNKIWWSEISKPKSDIGLGIIDLRLVNLFILGNRCWRLIFGGEALWKDIISV